MQKFNPSDEMADRMYHNDEMLCALSNTRRFRIAEAMKAAGVSSPDEFDAFLKETKVSEIFQIEKYLTQKNPTMNPTKRREIAEKLAEQKLESEMALGFAVGEIIRAEREAEKAAKKLVREDEARRNEEAEALLEEVEVEEFEWDFTHDDDVL